VDGRSDSGAGLLSHAGRSADGGVRSSPSTQGFAALGEVKRPKLTAADRFLWARLSRYWTGWRSALVIVKPETVIAWHRKGLRLFWTWKVRRGQPGRPPVCQETRKLIRQMSLDNPLWGAPRIHGELLKLGIDMGLAFTYLIVCRLSID
jgi:hypothetical protein